MAPRCAGAWLRGISSPAHAQATGVAVACAATSACANTSCARRIMNIAIG